MFRRNLFELTLAVSLFLHVGVGWWWASGSEQVGLIAAESGRSSIRLQQSIAASPAVPQPQLEEVAEELPMPELPPVKDLVPDALPTVIPREQVPRQKLDVQKKSERQKHKPKEVPILETKTEVDVSSLSSPASEAQTGADELPRKLASNPAPLYPAEAVRNRVEGRVAFRARIDERGSVAWIRVQQSSGSLLLDESALKTCRHWRFEPAKLRGQPVAQEVIFGVRFYLTR